ncbi:hypothetical protein D9M71_661250 [compost metagenome]
MVGKLLFFKCRFKVLPAIDDLCAKLCAIARNDNHGVPEVQNELHVGLFILFVLVGGLVSKNDTLCHQSADRFHDAVVRSPHKICNLAAGHG